MNPIFTQALGVSFFFAGFLAFLLLPLRGCGLVAGSGAVSPLGNHTALSLVTTM